jgi:hypothetical protein
VHQVESESNTVTIMSASFLAFASTEVARSQMHVKSSFQIIRSNKFGVRLVKTIDSKCANIYPNDTI